MQLNSESQLDAKLHLPWVEHIARRAEPELRRRWRIRVVDAAPHRVDVLDVLPVEEVEDVEREVEMRAVVHGNLAAHSKVHARVRRSLVCVAPDERRTIGVGVAVELEVA